MVTRASTSLPDSASGAYSTATSPDGTTHGLNDQSHALLEAIWSAAGGAREQSANVSFTGVGDLSSCFAVTELAAASVGAAGLAVATLTQALEQHAGLPSTPLASVEVDRRLASFWFSSTLRPQGWTPPKHHEVAAADYLAQDGWLRLHTNAAHHRDAALRALGCAATPEAVTAAVAGWRREALEARVIAEGGCAAIMMTPEEWLQHPQGQALKEEPLIHWTEGDLANTSHSGRISAWLDAWRQRPAQPLSGLKVLDMTRVLAGPAATRMLAGLGAQVLRLDSPMWDESNAPEMTLGKHCAEIDLRQADQRAHWVKLLSEADVLVHGYRSDALAKMGLDAQARQRIRPGLIDVSLDAYGFTGPWANRRGFDSLVQMSIGIASIGQTLKHSQRPEPLPVQALDHATGYILATAVLKGLERLLQTGKGTIARASLARTGMLLLTTLDPARLERPTITPETAQDLGVGIEHTGWGEAKRIQWPVSVSGVEMKWLVGAGPLKRDQARWL